jgi:hypothetical protein
MIQENNIIKSFYGVHSYATLPLNLPSPFAHELKKLMQSSVDKGREEMDWSSISLLGLQPLHEQTDAKTGDPLAI